MQQREIANAVRQQLTNKGLYRINVGSPEDVDRKNMSKVWMEENLISISSWGLNVDEVFKDTGAGVVNDKKFADQMQRDVRVGIDWDSVQEHFKYNPGLARGVHQTFYEDFENGIAVIANLWDYGTAIGTVKGPVNYDPEAPTCEYDDAEHHVFTRKVNWARDQGGEVLIMANKTLPSSLQPLPRTLTNVNDLKQIMELSNLCGFLAESGDK